MSVRLPSARELDYWPAQGAYALIATSGYPIPKGSGDSNTAPSSVFSILENDPPYREMHRFPPVKCKRAKQRRKELVQLVRRLNAEEALYPHERSAICAVCRRNPEPALLGKIASTARKNSYDLCVYHFLVATRHDRQHRQGAVA